MNSMLVHYRVLEIIWKSGIFVHCHMQHQKNWNHLQHRKYQYMIFMFDMYAVPVVQIYCLNYQEYVWTTDTDCILL
jgi:hypothetical protein